MKFTVPIHVVVDCANEAEATAHAKKIDTMMQQPMVKLALNAQGVKVQSATVGKPAALKA